MFEVVCFHENKIKFIYFKTRFLMLIYAFNVFLINKYLHNKITKIDDIIPLNILGIINKIIEFFVMILFVLL